MSNTSATKFTYPPQRHNTRGDKTEDKNVADEKSISATLKHAETLGSTGLVQECGGRTGACVTGKPSNGAGCGVVADKKGDGDEEGDNDFGVTEL
jgi:hypothetical protein